MPDVVWPTLVGLAISVGVDQLMRPRARLGRPWGAWALHGGLWLCAHAGLTGLVARPWFAAAGVSAFWLMLALVNNAKVKALREPFVVQDYEYFTDAVRYPRLYIPFLGWGKFLGAAAGFVLAVGVGLWGEPRMMQWRWVGVEWLVGMCGIWWGNHCRLPISLQPVKDMQTLGLAACLWCYGKQARRKPALVSPFTTAIQAAPARLPHLVSIQSESFFDARTLDAPIHPEILAGFDRVCAEAALHGTLEVPAWGANTVRTEFAFLTGVAGEALGVHRFNPYRALASNTASVASSLKGLGYRTVCVHPYPVGFYRRNRVFPWLGFDEFLDIRSFAPADRFGPYVGDIAVAERVAALLRDSTQPLYVHVITMENHGPLHLETVQPQEAAAFYFGAAPTSTELTVYLRHLRNADRMVTMLREALAALPVPASLCWYGDHVPIMPETYAHYGTPDGQTPFACWHNFPSTVQPACTLPAHSLAQAWLQSVGVIGS